MAFSIFNSLATKILEPITAAADVSSQLVSWVTPFFLVGITIYLMSYGFDVMRGGGGNQYLLDALAKVARPFLVLNLALAAGMYATSVVPFFTELRNELSALYGAKGMNSYAAIDVSMDNMFSTMSSMIPYIDQNISFMNANFTGLVMYVCMFVIEVAMLFYGIVAVVNLLVVDASLAVILGVGPLFIACFAWQATARFFDTWLSAVLKYVLTAVFIAMVVGIANGVIFKFALGVKQNPELGSFIILAATTVAIAGVLIALLLRAPALAADLVGGASVALSGPMQMAKSAMGMGNAVAAPAAAAGRAGAYAAGAAGGAAAQTPLGVRVLRDTMRMREAASSAASGVKNFGDAVAGRSTNSAGQTTSGHGASNAFKLGRQATSQGTGTISGGGRPVPKVGE